MNAFDTKIVEIERKFEAYQNEILGLEDEVLELQNLIDDLDVEKELLIDNQLSGVTKIIDHPNQLVLTF
ncbi:MAG: hypothetical protein ACUZ77_11100 [Candidatus Brocadiales bacterium]